MNDKAYVVTFEKTDPLFILDIKDPNRIQILSEFKSPGFSTLLQPLRDNQLLGVGFDVQPDIGFSWFGGIKISLFNAQNPLSLMETSTLKFGDRGSYSEATFNNKGLYVLEAKNQLLIPLVEIVKDHADQKPWNFGTRHLFSGAILFEIKDQQVIEKNRFTHKIWREASCGSSSYAGFVWWNTYTPSLDIQRTIASNGCFDTFSRFGVMRFCPSSDTPTAGI